MGRVTHYRTDAVTSHRMRRVRQKHTAPEVLVQQILKQFGYRLRFHPKDVPGSPDIVIYQLCKAIFVHGCFWHRHSTCGRGTMPKRNVALWKAKFKQTILRDHINSMRLRRLGWSVLVVWECNLNNQARLFKRIRRFLQL